MIENIRSYNEEVIDFPRGITLFEGDIGSGKSTILMGIEFALFGLGSEKADALLAKKADQGSITLNFSVDEKNYEIKRTLKRSSTSISQDAKNTYIKIGDEKEPLSPAELKQRVLQILKFNEPGGATAVSKIFRYAVFTPQEEMKQVLSDTEKRLETIRRAFGVEDYKTAAENASKVLTELNVQIVRFEERTRGIEDFEKNIKDANGQILKIKTENTEAEKIKNEKESKKKEIELDLEKYNEKIKTKTKLETDLSNLETKIIEKEEDLEEITVQIKDKNEALKTISKELDGQKKIKKPTTKSVSEIELEIKKFQNIDRDITELQPKITQISSSIDMYDEYKNKKYDDEYFGKRREKFHKEDDKLVEEMKRSEENKKKLEKTIVQNETKQENLQKEITKFTKIGSQCPYCKSKITKEHLKKIESERKEGLEEIKEILKKDEKDLQKIKSQIEEQEINSQSLSTRVEMFESQFSAWNTLTETMKELQPLKSQMNSLLKQNTITREKEFVCDAKSPVDYLTELKDALVDFQNSQKISDGLKREQNSAQKDLGEYQEKRGRLEDDLKNSREKSDNISKEIRSYEGLDDKIDNIKEKLGPIQEIIDEKNDTLSQNRVRLKNENEKLNENQQNKKNAEKWQQSYLKYRNYYDWIKEFFIPTIDKIEKQVLLSIQQNFNEIYRRWYSMLLDDPTKESRIDENFTPIVDQDGYEQNINYLSGGEKTSIALAYRLTLNSLIRKETESMKSNLLILDEPTDGFSKTQLSKVRTLLEELHSQQIILVSHEKELETYVDNVFHVSRSEEYSRVTRLN